MTFRIHNTVLTLRFGFFAVLAVLLLNEPITLRLALCSVPILGGICLALVSRQKA